ncbi:MAG: ATP-binding protein, partial [Candidatus Eisenbacteria bacterium]
ELDRDQVVQVLTNLLSNAIAAMPLGGDITLRMTDDERRVTFEVEDTGTGIPAEHLGRIFDPFFTTKPMGEGTGLGLSVSYGIVKLHGGDIRVVSRADAAAGPTGTTFTVSLPRRG